MTLPETDITPAEERQTYPAWLTDVPFSAQLTRAEARERAEVAIKIGLASIAFGLVLWALMPKSS